MAGNGRRIVMTGATGFIGTLLTRKLAERGDRVTALVRDVERSRSRLPEAAEHVAWRSGALSDEAARAIDGADAVINLAGATVASRWTDAQKRAIYDSRIPGTRAIVEAIGRASVRPRALVSASAVGYYGTSETASFTETSPPGADFLAQVCKDWEAEAMKAEPLGVRVVCVRTGIVLHPRGGALAKLLPTFRMFAGGVIASGRQWMPWVHYEDEIGIFLWALDDDQVSGPVNAAAPEAVNNKEFTELIGKTLGRPTYVTVPKFALDLVFGEGSMVLTEGQRVVPERTVKLGYWFVHPRAAEAMRDLLK